MSNQLDIRPYQEGDEIKIAELFSEAYAGRHMPLSSWRWRFQDNPSGPGLIELAWDHDKLVAHYAVTVLSMSVTGQKCSAGLSGTTMTHPDYRGRNLFPILAQRTYREMANRGMALVCGFPNTPSHRGFISRLGWQDLYEIPVLRLQTASQKVMPVLSSHVQQVFTADERFDRFWEEIKHDHAIITCRNGSYLNWRFFSNPAERYQVIAYVVTGEIKGYAAVKRYQDELQIVDLLIGMNTGKIGESLIAYVIDQAIRENVRSVSLWLNVTHPFHHLLEKIGFRPESPITYFGGLTLNHQNDFAFLDFRRWYFTMSDSDVF